MKIVCVADHFMEESFYRDCMAKFPEIELIDVPYFGSHSRNEMREMVDKLEKEGAYSFPPPAQLYESIKDADVLMVHLCPVPRDLMEAAPNLKYILTNRGGLENIDLKAAHDLGIPILNNPAHNANAVAEFTVALMIAEARNMVRSYYSVKHGDWRENYSNFGNIWEIRGKTVGLIGFSTIGRLVAEKLSSFGVKMLVSDPKCDPEDELVKRLNIKVVDLTTLMKESDYVSLHARASGCFLTREVLSLMKPTAIFVNTARAYMVDYEALYELLRDKKIMGAAIDVFPMEPLPIDYPLLTLDNCTVTTHRAGDTVNA